MSDWQEIFASRGVQGDLGDDFEERVFAKIKRKKRQRKIGYAATAAASALLLAVLLQVFRPVGRPLQLPGAKEEIPVSENLYFSAFDSRTDYSLEPVALRKKPASQEAVSNQI